MARDGESRDMQRVLESISGETREEKIASLNKKLGYLEQKNLSDTAIYRVFRGVLDYAITN